MHVAKVNKILYDIILKLPKEIPMYAGGIKKYIKGNPEAVLMVEFIDTEKSVYEKKIKDLEYLVLNQNKKSID